MNHDEKAIEKEINDKGLNAPRIRPDDLDKHILTEQFYVFPGTTVTVCCLTLQNGFNVIGQSAAASPENFDQEVGRKVSRQNARNQIWPLLGYALKEKLHAERGAVASGSIDRPMGQAHK